VATAGGIAVNRIAKWDTLTNTWSALIYNGIVGVDYLVLALTSIGTDLYVGGDFPTAGGIIVNRIAKWDTLTNTWSALIYNGIIGVESLVFALISIGNDLYVGGDFSTAGGIIVNNIAKWDTLTNTWSALIYNGIIGVDSSNVPVFALTSIGNDLYVGGTFTMMSTTLQNGDVNLFLLARCCVFLFLFYSVLKIKNQIIFPFILIFKIPN